MNGALGHTGVLLGFVAALVGMAVIGIGLARGRTSTASQRPGSMPRSSSSAG